MPYKNTFLIKLFFIETNLRSSNLLSTSSQFYFTDSAGYGQYNLVDDDHAPFLEKSLH
jgi:hypothetical protein